MYDCRRFFLRFQCNFIYVIHLDKLLHPLFFCLFTPFMFSLVDNDHALCHWCLLLYMLQYFAFLIKSVLYTWKNIAKQTVLADNCIVSRNLTLATCQTVWILVPRLAKIMPIGVVDFHFSCGFGGGWASILNKPCFMELIYHITRFLGGGPFLLYSRS
jgi:hypothetical protein